MERMDRLPAIPLITSDPYLSIWMPADTMTQTDAAHWSGPVKPIRGAMTVDGAPARFLGLSEAPEAKLAGENVLQGTLKSLFALAESYPDLKANQNFLELSDQLRAVEEDIANSRKYYNAVVKQFNTKCEVFPSNLIASIFHFEKKPMFEVGAAEERENVKVSFN